MRFSQTESPIAERFIFPVKSAEASASIPVGTPLILNLSNTAQPTTVVNGRAVGSEDGLQVVLPSTAGAVGAQHLRFGVALGTFAAGTMGESMIFGMTKALVVLQTRAGTSGTSSWSATTINSASTAALSVDTVNNAFNTLTSLAANDMTPKAVLLDSASAAASATNATDTRTAILKMMRVFVRMM